jgi:acylphosphatase
VQEHKKQYTITLTGKVQEAGFRGYLQDICNRLRVPSIVYNTSADELKLLCEADQQTLTDLSAQIREYRLGEIRGVSIEEGLELPYPSHRGIIGIEQEIYTRLDEGVKILHAIKDDTKAINDGVRRLDSIKDDTKAINDGVRKVDKKLDKLDDISETLREISSKL